MAPTPMTHEQILALEVGDTVRVTFDITRGKASKTARYTEPQKILRICSKGVLNGRKVDGQVVGRAWACFYRDLGGGKEYECRVVEGDENVVLEGR